jgi:hypothetical protein
MLRQDLAAYIAARRPGGPAELPTELTMPELDRLEEAIAHVMLGDVALLTLAEGLGRTRGELERLASAYRAAGRKTLTGD